jgi:acetylornithine/LysW-gamma-L-lysine aminotransferase
VSQVAADVKSLEARHDSGVYPKREVVIVRGEGARLWDAAGREYIDCASGYGVALLGHGNVEVAEAVAAQARTLVTCPGTFYNDQRARLLARLAAIAPGDLRRAYLCNSGAEAVEAAIKLARLSTGRPGIAAAMRGFHGRTMGALSATWNKAYREPFEPLVPGFTHVPYDNVDRAEAAIGDDTAAVIVEIVQGEGGVRPGSEAYFAALRRLCDERGTLLIVDEVQTGFGRTGRLFACQHHDLRPDLLCLGKGMAGGVPMGATLFGEWVASAVRPGVHGSTLGGNPLACAAALATIGVIEEQNLPAQAAEKGDYLMERLRALDAPQMRQVRGLGLMVGLELREKVRPYLMALMDRGLLALPAGKTVLRLLPPLVITYDELDTAIAALTEVLHDGSA